MEKANADYDKAKEIIPDLPRDIKISVNREQASAYIEEADANKHYEQGNVYLAKGEYNEAIVEYTEAIRLYAEERRGGGISVTKSLEESLQEFGKSTLRLINYRDAHRKRGDAYAAIGDMEKANADYDKAKEIIPDLPS
jgi:tetratricopeptide (TPR) repeat protein